MSCLRMDEAFSISSSSAKASRSAGFLFLRSCSFIALQAVLNCHGEHLKRGNWSDEAGLLALEQIHRRSGWTRTGLPASRAQRTDAARVWGTDRL